MTEMKLTKGRRKKEPVRATDDVLHDITARPMNGVHENTVSIGQHAANGDRGTHAMIADLPAPFVHSVRDLYGRGSS